MSPLSKIPVIDPLELLKAWKGRAWTMNSAPFTGECHSTVLCLVSGDLFIQLNTKRGGSDLWNEICGDSRKSKEKMRLEKNLPSLGSHTPITIPSCLSSNGCVNTRVSQLWASLVSLVPFWCKSRHFANTYSHLQSLGGNVILKIVFL